MPRRKNGIESTVNMLTQEYVSKMLAAVGGFIEDRFAIVMSPAKAPNARLSLSKAAHSPRRARRGGTQAGTLCYHPNCKNRAVPRFGMFCAAEHKNLPKSQKIKYAAKRRALA